MKHLITAIALLCSTCAIAQVDSVAKAHERAWMKPAYDGRMYHQLPPPANLVNGGLYLEHSGQMADNALLTLLIGSAAGGVLHLVNDDVGRGVIGASIGGCIYFEFRANRSKKRSGRFLQSGYRITERYDILPDSVDVGPHMRIVPVR